VSATERQREILSWIIDECDECQAMPDEDVCHSHDLDVISAAELAELVAEWEDSQGEDAEVRS